MMVVSDKQEYELRAHLLRRAGFGSSKNINTPQSAHNIPWSTKYLFNILYCFFI